MLNTPQEALGELTLQEIGLAKSYLETASRLGGATLNLTVLRERIAHCEHHDPSVAAPGDSRQDRRAQVMLRNALEKCARDQMDDLTLIEVDLIANCCEVMLQRGIQSPNEARLRGLLGQAVAGINERCARLTRLTPLLTSDDPEAAQTED